MCFYYKAQKQKRLLQMIQKKTKTAITMHCAKVIAVIFMLVLNFN